MKPTANGRGFTLIELIIVVAIIGLLAAALFVAVDPAKRIGEARDAQRWSDVTAVLNAILTYTVDTTTLPTSVASLAAGSNYAISVDSTADAGTYTCPALGAAGASLSKVVLKDSLVATYLATLPVDPSLNPKTTAATGYYMSRSSAGRIKVGSCHESSYTTASIEVQR